MHASSSQFLLSFSQWKLLLLDFFDFSPFPKASSLFWQKVGIGHASLELLRVCYTIVFTMEELETFQIESP